jgi:hypothetical protein
MFLLQSLPHCLPAEYEQWLGERGLEPFDSQDRVVRGSEPFDGFALPRIRELSVERVGPETADEWAGFLQGSSSLGAGRWLQGLVGRPGWHQYVAREDRGPVRDPGHPVVRVLRPAPLPQAVHAHPLHEEVMVDPAIPLALASEAARAV